MKTPWDQIEVDETVSETDHAASESIDTSIPVGKFLCTVMECDAEEKDLSDYTIYIAGLQCRIDHVIDLEQDIMDEDGNPIKREGENLRKVLPVKDSDIEKYNSIYNGIMIPFEVFLYHHSEKKNTKKRRHFCAKRIGIMSPQATELKTKDWANAPGNQVVLITEWNHWVDKETSQPKKNVKVGWSGLDYVGNYPDAMSALDAAGGPGQDDAGSNNIDEDEYGDI